MCITDTHVPADRHRLRPSKNSPLVSMHARFMNCQNVADLRAVRSCSHSNWLSRHSSRPCRHSSRLSRHSSKLSRHSSKLSRPSSKLSRHSRQLSKYSRISRQSWPNQQGKLLRRHFQTRRLTRTHPPASSLRG